MNVICSFKGFIRLIFTTRCSKKNNRTLATLFQLNKTTIKMLFFIFNKINRQQKCINSINRFLFVLLLIIFSKLSTHLVQCQKFCLFCMHYCFPAMNWFGKCSCMCLCILIMTWVDIFLSNCFSLLSRPVFYEKVIVWLEFVPLLKKCLSSNSCNYPPNDF